MNNNMKTIIKIIGIILCLIILVVICYFTVIMNKTVEEEQSTPVIIPPVEEKIIPEKPAAPAKPILKKPMMRDENDRPKSDYKVPEIG